MSNFYWYALKLFCRFSCDKLQANMTSYWESVVQCKANLIENLLFQRPKSSNFPTSNHMAIGMQHVYPFSWYIPEAFKNGLISSA